MAAQPIPPRLSDRSREYDHLRKTSLTAALATGVAALAIAACGGEEDSADATAADPGAGIVSVESVDGTNVVVDSQGRTLYSAAVEQGGEVLCTGSCTSVWDPVAASAMEADAASEDLALDLGVVTRPDGGDQLTYDGVPLYTFTEEGPGRLDGDGIADDFEGTRFEWSAATTGRGSASGGSEAPSYGSPY
jgi:predicted lipoprotein with Yx(FWY)xxD motif